MATPLVCEVAIDFVCLQYIIFEQLWEELSAFKIKAFFVGFAHTKAFAWEGSGAGISDNGKSVLTYKAFRIQANSFGFIIL